MNVTSEFFIQRLFVLPKISDLENVVAKVEWVFLVTDGNAKSIGRGVTFLDLSELSPGTFVNIAELSAETVIEWVVAAEGGDEFLTPLMAFHTNELGRVAYEKSLVGWEAPLLNSKRWDEAYAR